MGQIYTLYDFGIFIELMPDEEEKAVLRKQYTNAAVTTVD